MSTSEKGSPLIKKQINSLQDDFIIGIKNGIPIALGYIPIAVTFGLVANSAGLPNYISILMSVLVFAGASQFVAVNLFVLQTGHWEIITTTLIINLRHFLMTASISQKLKPHISKKLRGLIAFGITDETFSLASLKEEDLTAPFMLGLNFIAYSSWIGGTILGVLLGSQLPTTLQNSMGIALYAMFIGLLVPGIKKSRSLLTVSLLAMIINSALHWLPIFNFLSRAWRIISATIIASGLGVILFPERKDI